MRLVSGVTSATDSRCVAYPITRHIQRYEFLTECKIVDNKKVLDVGCGNAYGSLFLTQSAALVIGIDIDLARHHIIPGEKINWQAWNNMTMDRLQLLQCSVFDINAEQFDICVAMEVIEHVPDPDAFLAKLVTIAPEAIISSPMVAVTGKTVNPDHVQEFSNEDFMAMVSKYYDIQQMFYQTSLCQICLDKPEPQGCSFDRSHIVQIAYAKRKEGLK